jgi:D-3-phosphoglycerate dehydrogenase / 2-oxoglutarate reductase
VRNGIWKREENRGEEIQGKTIGIIGFGNMGSTFAKKLRGLEAKIIAYDKYLEIDSNEFDFVEQVSMEAVFESADIVSLHLPLSEETNYFADEKFFNAFKKPIYFINTARGKNVDTSALCDAMKNNKVKGAALDVLEYESSSFEKIDANHLPEPFKYLISSDRAILTPHIAGWTHESNIKIAEVLVNKIQSLVK